MDPVDNYYCVTANTTSSYETKKLIGYYQYEETAEEVQSYINSLYRNDVETALNVEIRTFKMEEAPEERISQIFLGQQLNFKECGRLKNLSLKV